MDKRIKKPHSLLLTDWYQEVLWGITHEIVLKESGTTASFFYSIYSMVLHRIAQLFFFSKKILFFMKKKYLYHFPYDLPFVHRVLYLFLPKSTLIFHSGRPGTTTVLLIVVDFFIKLWNVTRAGCSMAGTAIVSPLKSRKEPERSMVRSSKTTPQTIQALEEDAHLYKLYKNVVENLREGIWIGKKNKGFTTLYWNRAAEKISGYNAAHLKGRGLLKMVPALKEIVEEIAANPNGSRRRIAIERYKYNHAQQGKDPRFLNIQAYFLSGEKMIAIMFQAEQKRPPWKGISCNRTGNCRP